MNDAPQRWRRGEFTISTDRSELDLDAAIALLRTTFWAGTVPIEVLVRAVENSIAFGLYRAGHLIGFARVVTDRATYGYVTDVVVAAEHRGAGLGQWLTECIIDHQDLQHLRRLTLLTRDARTLYERCGFVEGPDAAHVYLERVGPRRRTATVS